jgi:aspartyl protease family protein
MKVASTSQDEFVAQEPERPWGEPPPRLNDRTKRQIVLVALVACVIFLIWRLANLFPRRFSDMDSASFIQLAGFAMLVASGLVFGRRIRFAEATRNIAIWLGVAGVLVLGYSYQDELAAIYARVRSEAMPSSPTLVGSHTMVLTADASGGFFVTGEVNGLPVRFLVDTGASDIVLSPGDAKRLDVDVTTLQFTREYETANGSGRGAPYVAESLAVGPVKLLQVPMSINQAPMDASLLGMTFLKQLDSFQVQGRKLILKWKSKS